MSQPQWQQSSTVSKRYVIRDLLGTGEHGCCAGLDLGARERFLASIDQLASSNRMPGLVFVTHHIEEIMPSFQNLLILQKAADYGQGVASR